MSETPGKAPKKVKEKKQSPEERLEAMRYNHMMYGPTDGEMKLTPKKIDFGASYLKHPKFQNLMSSFKRGAAFKFDITAGGTLYTISSEGNHLYFDGKVLFYTRPLNKHEDNLFLERATCIQFQTTDAVVHLIFAVLRSFPELGEPPLQYLHHKFHYGNEILEFATTEQGTNLPMGTFAHNKPHERIKR